MPACSVVESAGVSRLSRCNYQRFTTLPPFLLSNLYCNNCRLHNQEGVRRLLSSGQKPETISRREVVRFARELAQRGCGLKKVVARRGREAGTRAAHAAACSERRALTTNSRRIETTAFSGWSDTTTRRRNQLTFHSRRDSRFARGSNLPHPRKVCPTSITSRSNRDSN